MGWEGQVGRSQSTVGCVDCEKELDYIATAVWQEKCHGSSHVAKQLKIWWCCSYGSGPCSISGPGTFTCHKCGQKEKRKWKDNVNKIFIFIYQCKDSCIDNKEAAI